MPQKSSDLRASSACLNPFDSKISGRVLMCDAQNAKPRVQTNKLARPLHAVLALSADSDSIVIDADEVYNNDAGYGDEIGDERVDEPGAALRYDQRRVRFVAAYVRIIDETGKANGARAAREAGYSTKTTKQIARHLLRRPQVVTLIQRKQAATYGTDELKGMMIQIARGDIGMLLNDNGTFNFVRAKRLGLTYLIKEISYHKSGEVRGVKLHSSVEAKKLLMQHEGMFQKASKNIKHGRKADEDRAWAEQAVEKIMESVGISHEQALEQMRFKAPTVFKLLNTSS